MVQLRHMLLDTRDYFRKYVFDQCEKRSGLKVIDDYRVILRPTGVITR